jgi:hypothetical protein
LAIDAPSRWPLVQAVGYRVVPPISIAALLGAGVLTGKTRPDTERGRTDHGAAGGADLTD